MGNDTNCGESVILFPQHDKKICCMKKVMVAFILLLLLTTLVACGSPASTTPMPTPMSTQIETATTRIVPFVDPALEVMVRGTMGKPSGDITVAEAKTVTSLNLAFEEWQKFVSEKEPISSIAGLENFTSLESLDLSGNAIADLTPLSALTNLKALILTGCAAEDYTPLTSLANLRVLILDHSTIADPTPLLALSNLNCLYLEGSQIRDFFPLADIRANLELADFDVAFTLAELGFNFDDNDRMALYETDKYDIRINHVEWGDPPQPDWQNCIRVVTGSGSGYKNAIGFYPVHNAYVVWMFNRNTQENYTYVYDVAANSFGCERAVMEAIVREAFGDVNDKDVLLTPFVFFDNILQEALGMPIDILYSMPFEPPTLKNLGFIADEEGNAACKYDEKEPHDMHISIYRPEWGVSPDNRSIEFYDDDVTGYNLLILYFAGEGKYSISVRKDEAACGFDYYPATKEYGVEFPDSDTAHQMFNAAFGTQGEDFYDKPLAYFEQVVQERFGMSIEELYALE